MVEMVIDSIRVSLMNYQRVVILKEKMAERYLPIWIGPAEADAIAVKLQGVDVPRPLTHDLLNSVIDVLGATINSIIVSDLKNDTFFAKISLGVDGGEMEVDARPSDALALAVRAEAPIYADEAVLDKTLNQYIILSTDFLIISISVANRTHCFAGNLWNSLFFQFI